MCIRDSYTNLAILGYEIPVGWLQFANPVIVVLFAPIFAGIWAQLARKNLDPSLPLKFAIGLLFMALSFFVMIIAVNIALESSPVGMQWLLLTYLFAKALLILGRLVKQSLLPPSANGIAS